jgi:hypothetical protein
MTCSDVQRVLPEVLDGGSNAAIATEFETHVKSCPDCSDLVSDLKLIASEARQLAASEEPSPTVWLRIAAELRSEELIRDPELVGTPATPRPVLVPTSPRRRWSAWWLAPVTAALVAAGSYVVSHKPVAQVAKQQAPPAATPAPVNTPVTETPAVSSAAPPAPVPQRAAQKSAQSSARSQAALESAARPTVEPAPSAEDQQFLSVVSTRAPSMRATYENQLQAVNADIRETQAYVKRNPRDAEARQHLMDAYQQKALLYQIALDRIQ